MNSLKPIVVRKQRKSKIRNNIQNFIHEFSLITIEVIEIKIDSANKQLKKYSHNVPYIV